MATTVSISVTKNSDGSYNITSGDTNAKAWVVIAAQADAIDDFSAIKERVWQKLKRQILQI
jgi:hypothetical protein